MLNQISVESLKMKKKLKRNLCYVANWDSNFIEFIIM